MALGVLAMYKIHLALFSCLFKTIRLGFVSSCVENDVHMQSFRQKKQVPSCGNR